MYQACTKPLREIGYVPDDWDQVDEYSALVFLPIPEARSIHLFSEDETGALDEFQRLWEACTACKEVSWI